jgi:hypothetical protein
MSEEMNQVYADRNRVVQLAALLAQRMGYPSGVRRSTAEDDWPVVAIQLPGVGEVAWHVPKSELVLSTTSNLFDAEWDGHTNDEKSRRILSFVTTPESDVSL